MGAFAAWAVIRAPPVVPQREAAPHRGPSLPMIEIAGAALVVATAYYGGQLVYGLGSMWRRWRLPAERHAGDQNWRTRYDSDVRPCLPEGSALSAELRVHGARIGRNIQEGWAAIKARATFGEISSTAAHAPEDPSARSGTLAGQAPPWSPTRPADPLPSA